MIVAKIANTPPVIPTLFNPAKSTDNEPAKEPTAIPTLYEDDVSEPANAKVLDRISWTPVNNTSVLVCLINTSIHPNSK